MQQEFDLPNPPPYRMAPAPDHGPRNLSMIAAAIGVGLLVLAVAWSFRGSSSHDIPYIEADNSPMRIKPENPGGEQFGSQSDDGGSGDSGGKLEAPAEVPNMELLHERMKAGVAPRAKPAPEPMDSEDEGSGVSETPVAEPKRAKETPVAPKVEKPAVTAKKPVETHHEASAIKPVVKDTSKNAAGR